MTDLLPNDADQATESERTTLIIAYVLHVLGPFSAFLLNLVGLILNHIKAAEARNHYVRSHHVWMLRTFWWTLLWSILCIPLYFILIGFVVYFFVGIWWIYRTVRGLINFSERRPMPI